jgi:alpha-beta hydrolase superfamily lysophospholipase
MKQTEFAWKTRDGAAIHAVEWRPEAAVKGVIAFVHGIGEHTQRYVHVAEAYTKGDFAMVAFDLPGHGRSEGKRGHASYALIMEQIDRLLEEARSRFPGVPVFLYGHSLGGSLILNYLLERKPKLAGAIATSPALATGAPVPAAKIAVAKIMSRLAPSFTLSNGLDQSGISRDAEVVRKYREDPLVHDQVSARLGLDLLEAGPRIIAHAGEIQIPLLLAQGSADRLVNAATNEAFAAAAGKNVTWKSFDGWYHELHNEPQKEEFFRFVLAWLSEKAP